MDLPFCVMRVMMGEGEVSASKCGTLTWSRGSLPEKEVFDLTLETDGGSYAETEGVMD